jgi:ParB-like chromosome segregation protein Spo0J
MQNKLEIETWQIAKLRPDQNNARKHSESNIDAIAKSLDRFGQRKPIVVVGDGTIVAGNGTVEAAKKLGWTEISIVRAPWRWTPDEVKAYALADNRSAELAVWDAEILADQLLELDSVGWDLSDLGFLPLSPDNIDEDLTRLPDDEDANNAVFMTFNMTLKQAEILKSAINRAKELRSFADTDNKNINSNAIVTVAAEWMEQISQHSSSSLGLQND